MDSFVGIIIIGILFILFAGITFLLVKKGFFSEKLPSEGDLLGLNTENEKLIREITFLEEKVKKLQQKINDLKMVIKKLEEQKEQLEKNEAKLKKLKIQKDEALSMVAHDIKNPASAIKNFVELLESYDLTAQEQHDIMSGLIEISSRIVKIANEFSMIVAEEYDTLKLHKTKTNFIESVDSIVKTNKVIASKKNIDVRLYQPSEELFVRMDEDKIKKVIDNYVENAIKYCPQKSRVEILTNKENNFVVLEVTDNGYGLTEDEIGKAFEKGSKLSTKPTGGESSSGLGLWISKKIVEEHNGKVWVKSKKGFGSTFAFKIPIE